MTSMSPPPSMFSTVPDGLPELGIGRHRRPEHGACLMEYVSVLAGLPFSDRPVCTHPALCTLAHRVNDATTHAGRPRLALLAPDLIDVTDDGPRSNVGATVVLGITTAGLRWAPHDRTMQRLQRRAAERHRIGARRWHYGLELALPMLMRHMKGLDDETWDRALSALLQQVAHECRTGVVVTGHRPLIDRIDRRQRAAR